MLCKWRDKIEALEAGEVLDKDLRAELKPYHRKLLASFDMRASMVQCGSLLG